MKIKRIRKDLVIDSEPLRACQERKRRKKDSRRMERKARFHEDAKQVTKGTLNYYCLSPWTSELNDATLILMREREREGERERCAEQLQCVCVCVWCCVVVVVWCFWCFLIIQNCIFSLVCLLLVNVSFMGLLQSVISTYP